MKTQITVDRQRICRKGFSLVELLATLGIIGILLGLSFPALQAVRQAARKTRCSSNLRQLMTATLAYESTGSGFPTATNARGGSLVLALLPFLDQNELRDRYKIPLGSGETDSQRLAQLSETQIEVLNCPATFIRDNQVSLPNQGTYPSNYFGVAGPVGTANSGSTIYNYSQLAPNPVNGAIGLSGLFSPQRNGKFAPRHLKDVKDGTSNTFAFGEISSVRVADTVGHEMMSGWAFGGAFNPTQQVTKLYSAKSISVGINQPALLLNQLPFGSNHPRGSQFALIDGSVRFVDDRISVEILKTFSSINENEPELDLESY